LIWCIKKCGRLDTPALDSLIALPAYPFLQNTFVMFLLTFLEIKNHVSERSSRIQIVTRIIPPTMLSIEIGIMMKIIAKATKTTAKGFPKNASSKITRSKYLSIVFSSFLLLIRALFFNFSNNKILPIFLS